MSDVKERLIKKYMDHREINTEVQYLQSNMFEEVTAHSSEHCFLNGRHFLKCHVTCLLEMHPFPDQCVNPQV